MQIKGMIDGLKNSATTALALTSMSSSPCHGRFFAGCRNSRNSEALLGQVQIIAACNALHPIQPRLARWILQTSDRVDGNVIPLAQELLSEMLGVRRSSVSEVANSLQAAGLIRYSRGMIETLDRKALEAASCECYETIRKPGDPTLRS